MMGFFRYYKQRIVKFAKWAVWVKSIAAAKAFWWLSRLTFFVVHFRFRVWYSELVVKYVRYPDLLFGYNIFSCGVIYYEYFAVVLGLELFLITIDYLTNAYPWLAIALLSSEPLPEVFGSPPMWEKHYFTEPSEDDSLETPKKAFPMIKASIKLLLLAVVVGWFFGVHFIKKYPCPWGEDR